jgi:hypothetical protein
MADNCRGCGHQHMSSTYGDKRRTCSSRERFLVNQGSLRISGTVIRVVGSDRSIFRISSLHSCEMTTLLGKANLPRVMFPAVFWKLWGSRGSVKGYQPAVHAQTLPSVSHEVCSMKDRLPPGHFNRQVW